MVNEEGKLDTIVQKKYFLYLISGVFVILGFFLATLVISEIVGIQNKIKEGRYIGQEIERKNTISVSGEGEIWAKPDLAQTILSVLTESKTVAQAQQENTKKMNAVIKFVKDLGIEEKDLKTTQYNISPRYEYLENRRILVGYEVSQSLEVKIRDFTKIGEILERATAYGANTVGSLSFTFDNPESLKEEARKQAIENAKAKAEKLASDLGVKFARIIGFSEGFVSPWQPYFFEAKAEAVPPGEVPTIEPGENAVRVNVTITYEID